MPDNSYTKQVVKSRHRQQRQKIVTMNQLVIVLLISLLYSVLGFSRYPRFIPNAENVIVGGIRAIGLGHSDLTERRGSSRTANPFGLDVIDADRATSNNDEIWPSICDLDSDGDNISNRVELCDPDCLNIGGEPACVGGATLTHPGFPDIDGVEPVIPNNAAAETDLRFLKAHGWLMIFSWVILAPVGIAMPLIFKKGKSAFWFNYHQHLLGTCVALTLLSFALLIGRFKVEPIELAFEDPGNNFSKHVIIGLFVVIIAIIQPISGHCRPSLPKDDEEKTTWRMVWEIQHQWTGRLGLILAFVAIDYGIPLVYEDTEAVGIVLIVLLLIAGLVSFIYVIGFRAEVSETYMGAGEENKAGDTEKIQATGAVEPEDKEEKILEAEVAEDEKEEEDDLLEKL